MKHSGVCMKKIIFIQGIHNPPERDEPLLEAIRSLGHEVQYFPMLYTLEESDKQLALIQDINAFLEKQSDTFTILGHSFGGIISYSLRDDVYTKVDSIITVASPHRVPFAWFKVILDKLPYKRNITVNDQRSYGFLFDRTVPFVFAKYENTQSFRLLWGRHNRILLDDSVVKEILV